MPKRPFILLTNDDGVQSPGLQSLAAAMKKIGRTVIVAPDRDNSAASHSLTMNRPLKVCRLEEDIYSVDGTPADCVTLALSKILSSPPDLLVSGINPGANLGNDISYSGTVSAAREGAIRGIPSFAVSLAGKENFRFKTAADFAGQLAVLIFKYGMPKETLLNVNVPNLNEAEIKGVKVTRQGRRQYKDGIKEITDPWGRPCFWIGGGTPTGDRGEGSDSHEILENYISITPIHLDLSNYDVMTELEGIVYHEN